MTHATAILAGGCFWCTEAVMQRLEGVHEVVPGYVGGHVQQPGYREVCAGRTGHAEAVRVAFDPERIAYADLLDVFLATHDPTQLDRQGNDVGTQYRSAIFPLDEEQRAEAERAISRAAANWQAPIVTRIEQPGTFWEAEPEHRDYYDRVGDRNPYCTVVITPKLTKLTKAYAERLRR